MTSEATITHKSVGTKMSEPEFAILEERPHANGQMLLEWVRDALLAATVDGVPESGEAVPAELLALSTLFLNLQFRAASQGPMSEAEMQA